MKGMPSTLAGCILVCAFGAVLGWHLGGDPAPSIPDADTPAASRSAARTSSPHASDIARIQHSGDLRERLRMTLDLAKSIPVADIDAWLDGRWFNPGDGYESTLFKRILKDRRSLHSVGEPTLSEMLETFLEQTVCGMPEGETRERAEMMHLFALLAEQDPAALEAALGEMIIPYRYYAKDALVGSRLTADFDWEIRKLWARPDGWRLFRMHVGNADLLAKLLENPAGLPPLWRNGMVGESHDRIVSADVADIWWNADLSAAGFDREQAEKIRQEALRGIARHNRERAISLLDQVEFDTTERKEFIQGMFASGSLSDANAEQLLNLLKTDEDRQHAHEQLERKRRSFK